VHASQDVVHPSSAWCPQGERCVKSRGPVHRHLEPLVGPVHVSRAYCYGISCCQGFYPLDAPLALAPGPHQCDGQQAAAPLGAAGPYDNTAQVLCVETLAAPQAQSPVMVRALDGAHVPTRPETARGRCAERQRPRAQRPRWQGQYRDAQGVRCSLLDEERLVYERSGQQGQTEQAMAAALRQSKEAGCLPDNRGRRCVVADGPPWSWKQGQAICPHAQQGLDSYHGAPHGHAVAAEQ
jgi:hypothetical protein